MLSTGRCDHEIEDEGLYSKDIQSTKAMAGEPLHDPSQLLDRTMGAGLLGEVIRATPHNGPGTTLPSGIGAAARVVTCEARVSPVGRECPRGSPGNWFKYTSHFLFGNKSSLLFGMPDQILDVKLFQRNIFAWACPVQDLHCLYIGKNNCILEVLI